jgi:hypothetical protein
MALKHMRHRTFIKLSNKSLGSMVEITVVSGSQTVAGMNNCDGAGSLPGCNYESDRLCDLAEKLPHP